MMSLNSTSLLIHKCDRDMKVYIVHIKTAARPNDIMYDAFYFVSTESGEIIITND